MRWFGGCAPGREPVAPVGARVVWSDPSLWAVGSWPGRLMRTTEHQGRRLAVFGPCSAGEEELTRALDVSDLSVLGGAWAGSYTVVRSDAAGAVEVITDAAGACPVYTVDTREGAVWGSSSLALSSLATGRVDAEWLASYLLDKQTPSPGRSAWSQVAPIPPGHRLCLDVGGTASVAAWWQPARRTYADAAVMVRHALAEGVRSRTEETVTSADLAGTDSTALAVIASGYGPVTAVTIHPEGVTEGGDMAYAQALTLPGLTRALFPLQERHLPFCPADDLLPATDEPAPSTASWAMFSAQLRMVADAGSVCHLTGDGGDNLFLPPPSHLADLARRGHMLHLLNDAQAWARLRRISPWPVIGTALRGDAARLARPWITRPPWVTASPAPHAGADRSADAVLITEVRGAARPAYADGQLAGSLDLELHNPYFDAAVLDAVVSAPSWQRFSTRRYKPLLIDAIGDLLPEAHRQRATKGLFAGDFHRGLRNNLRRVLAMADGRLTELGLIDPVLLRTAIYTAALGADTIWSALLPTLGAEMWLEAIEAAPATAWTPIKAEQEVP